MELREKVIKGLECCLPPHDPDCDLCPYDSIDLRCRSKLHEDVMALMKAQEPIEARLHLCDSCKKQYPECDATKDGVVFGSGTGNDNIIGCTAYVNRWKAQEPRVMTLEEVKAMKRYTICAVEQRSKVLHTTFNAEYRGHLTIGGRDYIDFGLYADVSPFRRSESGYGKTWRCWTSRPTDKQMEATPWTQTNGL